MSVQQVLKTAFQGAHGILDQVLADLDQASLAKVPEGANIQTIQAILAHAVISEDFIVHQMLTGKPRIVTAESLEGTGVPMPTTPRLTPEWAASIQMDLPKFREYAKELFARTEETIAGMSDAEIAREFEGPFGKMPVSGYLTNFALYHVIGHTGEIAALKGVHGLKGLPF